MATGGQQPPKQICQPCELEINFVPAVKWCTECEERLCSECDRFHRKSKSTRNHHVVDISCIDKFSAVVDQVCPRHSEQNLDLFCVDHDELCCRQCMTEKHRTCPNLQPLNVASKDVKSSTLLCTTIADLDTVFKTLVTIKTKINEEKQSINDQQETVLQRVTAEETRIRQELENTFKHLRQEIKKRCSEYMEAIEKQADEVCKQKDRYEKKKQDVQHIVEHGSECQIFLLAQMLKTSIVEERSICENVIKNLFTVEIKHPENKTFVISPDCFGTISYNSCPLKLSLDYPNAQVHGTNTKNTLHFNSKLNFQSGTNLRIDGIAITEDNNILVCDKNSEKVFLFTPNEKHLGTYKPLGRPFGICVLHGLAQAVVTLPDQKKLEFFILTSMQTLNVVDCESPPWGITDTGDEIVVGIYKRKIQLFTRRGEARNVIDISGLDSTAICYAYPIGKNRILASCQHFYDLTMDGKINFKLNFQDYRANGICVDRSMQIYIATRNRFLRLSEDGKVVDNNVLDNTYDYGDLWDISFNNDFTKLYAATDDGQSLTVFDFK